MLSIRNLIMAALPHVLISTTLCAQDADDFWVGRTQAGELVLTGFDYQHELVPLPPVSGLLNGWADNEPGFDRVILADPAQDLYTLEAGAQIWLRVLEVDPAFRVIDASFNILDSPGEQTLLGGANLHTHVTWHINSNSPTFNGEQCIWRATFQLLDFGSTGYEPSTPFLILFTNAEWTEATGDWDNDGEVNLFDAARIPDCMNGPGQFPDPQQVTSCEVDCLNGFDFEADLDVDLGDFAAFQRTFGAP